MPGGIVEEGEPTVLAAPMTEGSGADKAATVEAKCDAASDLGAPPPMTAGR
jgi:hypothetical protein